MSKFIQQDGGPETHVVQPWKSCPSDPTDANFWGCRPAEDAYSHCAFVTNCGKKPTAELIESHPEIVTQGLQDNVLYDTCAPMTDISGWLMFVPFCLAGMGQIIMIASILDYTYAKCPIHFRSTSVEDKIIFINCVEKFKFFKVQCIEIHC